MTQSQKITQAISDFVKGGDERNIEKLDKVLHKDFRITNNGYMGTPGVTIIDKQKYLSLIQDKTFGGVPREMTILLIDETQTIAMVKLKLVSAENIFYSFNSLVLDSEKEWKLIHNLAIVYPNV